MRLLILVFLVTGTLFVDIIVYLIASFDPYGYLCDSPLYWLNQLNPFIEIFKRFYGLYILIYILSAPSNWKILMEALRLKKANEDEKTFVQCINKPSVKIVQK